MQGIEAFGLVESPIGHPTLLSSIKLAELVLGNTAPKKITAGWLQPQDPSAIRIFAAASEGLADRELVTSYKQCMCLVAKVGGLADWLEGKTGAGESALELDIHNVLAYMLLHEVGHIVSGNFPDTDGASSDSAATNGFNVDSTMQKEREIAADRYAATAIATAMTESGTDRGIAAARIATTLSELSWNLARHRLLDNFGGTVTHQRSLFWDPGLSHPNLEWRILIVNDAISNSPVSHQLLADFESSRLAEPSVLYRATKP